MFDVSVDKTDLIAVGRLEAPSGGIDAGSAAVWRSSDRGATWTGITDPSFARAAMTRILALDTGFATFGQADDPNAFSNANLIWIADKAP
jgi:hypothetical protein